MAATPRPQAVMLACVFVGFSAFVLLLELIQALSEWGTIEMQDGLQPTLTTLSERGYDLSMGELLGTLRWVGLVCVLVLVAAIVFAVYAARGDHVSRIGLTALAVVTALLLVPFGWLGLLQAVFLFAAAYILWSSDARQWYAAQHASAGTGASDDAPEPAANPWAAPATSEPAAEEPAPPVRSTHRPRAVLAAGLVTVIGSALVGGLSGLYLLIYGFARDEYVTLVQDGPFADLYSAGELDTALRAAFWACLGMLPLAAAGLAAGLSLLARLPIGRAATLALAWITAAAGVVLIPFGLLGTGAAVAVIVLLNRDESRAWTAR
ncbi:MAG: hypothetical protein ACRDOT_01500 [Aeromicrobium sp.]